MFSACGFFTDIAILFFEKTVEVGTLLIFLAYFTNIHKVASPLGAPQQFDPEFCFFGNSFSQRLYTTIFIYQEHVKWN